MTAPRYAFDANGAPIPSRCIRCGIECDALAADYPGGIIPDECGPCYAAALAAWDAAADRLFIAPARAVIAAALGIVRPR